MRPERLDDPAAASVLEPPTPLAVAVAAQHRGQVSEFDLAQRPEMFVDHELLEREARGIETELERDSARGTRAYCSGHHRFPFGNGPRQRLFAKDMLAA